jgi:putrescine transport system substrate-binding protein
MRSSLKRSPAFALLLALVLSALLSSAALAGRRQVNVYNWADFIGSDTVEKFERSTGIKVVYDTYDSEETAETKLMAGGSGYDVVVSSSEYFSRAIKAGVYAPLDRRLLPGWRHLSAHALQIIAGADPGNRYAIPYLHSINGFAYNVDMIRARLPQAPVDSLAMIFDPQVVSKFADCGVTFLDSPEDMLQLALNYLHLDPNSTRPADYLAAERLIRRVRPYIRMFDSSAYLNALANAEQCLGVSWSSDYAVSMARARAAGVTVRLAFTVPKEGANRSYSALLIPAGAPHPAEAYAFLNFLLRPEEIAAVTNDIYYGNDNADADALVAPEILGDPTLYPTPAMEARLYASAEAGLELERLRTRTWTRIKTDH